MGAGGGAPNPDRLQLGGGVGKWGAPGSPSRPQSAGTFSRGPTAGAQAQQSRGGRWARASSGAGRVSTRAPSAVPGAPVGARAPPGSPPRPNGFLCLRLPTESGRDTAVPPQGRGAPFVFLDRWVPIALTRVRSREGDQGARRPHSQSMGGGTRTPPPEARFLVPRCRQRPCLGPAVWQFGVSLLKAIAVQTEPK